MSESRGGRRVWRFPADRAEWDAMMAADRRANPGKYYGAVVVPLGPGFERVLEAERQRVLAGRDALPHVIPGLTAEPVTQNAAQSSDSPSGRED